MPKVGGTALDKLEPLQARGACDALFLLRGPCQEGPTRQPYGDVTQMNKISHNLGLWLVLGLMLVLLFYLFHHHHRRESRRNSVHSSKLSRKERWRRSSFKATGSTGNCAITNASRRLSQKTPT